MFTTKQYRAKAAEYSALSKTSNDPSQIRKYQDSSDSFSSLAENEEWLSNNFDKALQHSNARQSTRGGLAAEEEHVLRCLGASVIMHWNTIPKKLQRELFDTAGSTGPLLATAELRGQIARFLHRHKDGDAGTQSWAEFRGQISQDISAARRTSRKSHDPTNDVQV